MANYLLQENGTDRFLLQDGSGLFLLEVQPGGAVAGPAVWIPATCSGNGCEFSVTGDEQAPNDGCQAVLVQANRWCSVHQAMIDGGQTQSQVFSAIKAGTA